MGLIFDPKAEGRSLMLSQESICNGHATGVQCVHYWAMVQKIESANPDYLRTGSKRRLCICSSGNYIEFVAETELPVKCNKYVPSLREYEPDFETYNPLTPEEIDDIQDKDVEGALDIPSPVEQVEKMRADLSASDAVNALNEGKEKDGPTDTENS